MCVPAGSGRDAHDLLRSHRPACFRAAATCFGALLAMLHVVRGALFRAPFADLCAQGAQFLVEGAVPRHRIGAQAADRSAFDAASGTVVRAALADHVVEAIAAFGGAVVAGRDAVADGLGQMMAHGLAPFSERGWVGGRPHVTAAVSPIKYALSGVQIR